MRRKVIPETTTIFYRPILSADTGHRCFCDRAATWEKRTGEVHAYFCDRHWKLWRNRFEADPGPCRLRRVQQFPDIA